MPIYGGIVINVIIPLLAYRFYEKRQAKKSGQKLSKEIVVGVTSFSAFAYLVGSSLPKMMGQFQILIIVIALSYLISGICAIGSMVYLLKYRNTMGLSSSIIQSGGKK